jgi:hypothetical protein
VNPLAAITEAGSAKGRCLTPSQKTASIVVRLGGFASAIFGLMGLLYQITYQYISGGVSPSAATGQYVASAITWLGVGLVLIAFGRQLGSWLGKGLD